MSIVPLPAPSDLPGDATLRRWVIAATVCVLLLVVAVILPAERGIDPTGFGDVTGLTEMGAMKMEYARGHTDR